MLPWLVPVLLLPQTKVKPIPLTVESIMRGYQLVGRAPQDLRWSPDGQELTFRWAKADGSENPAYKSYVVGRDAKGLKLGDGSNWPAGPTSGETNRPTRAYTAILTDGDIYLKDPEGNTQRLTTDAKLITSPKVTLDGTFVAYLQDGDLYQLEVPTGKRTKLADKLEITPGELPASTGPTPAEQALAKSESTLFKFFPPAATPIPETSSRNNGGRFSQPEGSSASLNMTPAGNHSVFSRVQFAAAGRMTYVPTYLSRSGYTEIMRAYPKVGAPEVSSRLMLVNVRNGKKTEIAPPRLGRVGGLQWSPDGRYGITWATTNDHKDAWLYCFDSKTDDLKILWKEHDDAWLGGPSRGLAGWLPDGSSVFFASENGGFANLMTVSPDSGETKNLTPGDYEVSEVRLDRPNRRFVFVSSEGSPFRRHIDVVGWDGTGKRKLADISADEDATFAISPDGKSIAVVKSKPNAPAELYIDDIQVTSTPSEKWKARNWMIPKTVMIPARDGAKVPGRLYLPKTRKKGGPAVIFVHGAGYLQNIYDGWSHYYREYMFHNLLAERGYTVLDLDYRASAGYGKKWRTAIYRHMGGVDLTDQIDGANWLVRTQGVSKKRIGIYGGSYGGFITLMAMFKAPGVFAAGAALRPVSDWASYNHGYTSNILNLPQDDPEAYRISSPIYHAEGLKGALLICHGMVDTNVHFQDTVRLSERLIELKKRNWEVAPYPIEGHDFQRPESWMDEYSRILALFERTIGR